MRRRELPGGIPPPTKGELKRQAQAVQDLANRLVDAPAALVDGLDLPDKLADAVALARRIKVRGALVRQKQFVAKLMRGLDLDPVRAALDAHEDAARLDAARFRRVERWRDRLENDGPEALEVFAAENPGVDRATLAALAAAAAAERASGHGAGAGRKLFRYVQQLLEAR
ncbi:MAG TPA: ribosome biogenesis factor YjgA [Steroidobacteraceae bacterium]|nr:ribosome biogenesis factor YjgA [Steroidobacteraceae bacterium]